MMFIENYKDRLIRVTSPKLTEVLSNRAGYTSIEVVANKNCGTSYSDSVSLVNVGWSIDLTTAVSLNNTVYKLLVQVNQSLNTFNVITTPINLGYIDSNCTSNACNLETFKTYFAPLFKTQIDAWFASKLISTNVTVTIVGNVLTVVGVPSGFSLYEAQYALSSEETLLSDFFGFGDPKGTIILSEEALYIKPSFFSEADTILADGIYKITTKVNLEDNGGWFSESSCGFIDVETKCKIAKHIEGLIQDEPDEVSLVASLLHYSLVNGNNCGCNCEDLCKVYAELVDIISNTPETQDCGC